SSIKGMGVALFDKQKGIIYKTVTSHNSGADKLYKLDIQTNQITLLGSLPKQFITQIAAHSYAMGLTPNKEFLVLICNVASRLHSYDLVVVYDLKKKKWIYKH